MAISTVIFSCTESRNHPITNRPGYVPGIEYAMLTDTLIGVALLTIALLGLFHIIPLGSASPYLVGGAAGYLSIFVLFTLAGLKASLPCTKSFYLCKAPQL